MGELCGHRGPPHGAEGVHGLAGGGLGEPADAGVHQGAGLAGVAGGGRCGGARVDQESDFADESECGCRAGLAGLGDGQERVRHVADDAITLGRRGVDGVCWAAWAMWRAAWDSGPGVPWSRLAAAASRSEAADGSWPMRRAWLGCVFCAAGSGVSRVVPADQAARACVRAAAELAAAGSQRRRRAGRVRSVASAPPPNQMGPVMPVLRL